MEWKGRFASLSATGTALVAIEDLLPPAISLPLLVLTMTLAWRFTDGFLRTVGYGFVGGAVAGLLIMGPGFRLAMRVVAIMDPTTTPEFSFGGTLFIIVGIGGIFGAIFGAIGNVIRKSVPVPSVVVAGIVLAVVDMTMLLGDPGLREEFFGLGAGPWLNIPLFGVFVVGYGIAAMTIAGGLERKTTAQDVVIRHDVQV